MENEEFIHNLTDSIDDLSNEITGIINEVSVDAHISSTEIHLAMSRLVYNEQLGHMLQMFESLPDHEPTALERVELKAMIALLMGAMSHINALYDGVMLVPSKEEQERTTTAAKLLKLKFVQMEKERIRKNDG